MAIEELERFLKTAQIKISEREEVERLTLLIRETLKIPKEEMYCEEFYFPEEKKEREKQIKSFVEASDAFDKARGIKKTETIVHPPKPDYSYNPPKEILEKAREVFRNFEKILADNLFVSELSMQEYNSIIENVKSKVLLIQK